MIRPSPKPPVRPLKPKHGIRPSIKKIAKKKPVVKLNVKRAKAKSADYAKFMRSKQWKEQRQRVFERDGFRCTELNVVVPVPFYKNVAAWITDRCPYTKDDGPLHADHLVYGTVTDARIEATPDDRIVTKCPRHNLEREQWKFSRRLAVTRAP